MMMEKSILWFSDLDFFLILIWCLYNNYNICYFHVWQKKSMQDLFVFFMCRQEYSFLIVTKSFHKCEQEIVGIFFF